MILATGSHTPIVKIMTNLATTPAAATSFFCQTYDISWETAHQRLEDLMVELWLRHECQPIFSKR